MTSTDELIFVGTSGYVRAVKRESGADVWTTNLPNTGYGIVTLLVQDGVLFAGAGGRLFALDPRDGAIRWDNGLDGLGYKHMTLATMRASSMNMPALATVEDEERAAESTVHTSSG